MTDAPSDRAAELAVLRHLAGERDRCLTLDQLCFELQVSPAALSARVGRLEAYGMVRSVTSRTDAGVTYVIITPAGLHASGPPSLRT